MTTKALPDAVFTLAGARDPFLVESPYLMALLDLPSAQRRVIVRQVALLCMAIEGLDPQGALDLLGQIGILFVEVGTPLTAGDR
jgi:hypothetical protein